MANNQVAQINVNVLSNAATNIPKQVQQGLGNAQKIANNHPIKISVDTRSLRGLNLQKQLSLGVISREAQEFDKSIKAATARTLAFGIAAGSIYQLIRAFSSLVTTSINVEKALKEIQVISNASSESFKEYSKGLFQVAKSTSESFDNASKAMLEFARQGLTLNEQLNRTQSALILTKTAGIQVDKAVEAITATMNTFNTQLKSSADLVDRLTSVDNSFAVSTGDLAEGLERVGNTATEANVSLNETLGAITALQTRTARGGAVIGNALKSIFTRIGRPENIELLNELGIATETVSGKSRDAIAILKDLAGVYKTLSDSQKRQVGEQLAGLYQINQFNALIQDLSSSYSILDQATQKAANSQGSANERIKELNTTTSAFIERTKVGFTQLSSQIGKLTFETPLKDILGSADGIIGALSESLSKIDTDGEDIGSKLGEGILKGIGNVLGGSGIILLGRALGPLFGQFAKFITEVLKSSVGVTNQLKSQVELQNAVNIALINANATDRARIANAQTLNQQLELTLQLLRAQSTVQINPLTTALYERGVRPSGGGVNIPRKLATGYAPDVVRKEINSIKTSPDYSGNRNARPQILSNFSIGGKKQSVIINSAEKIIPTKSISSGYMGPDKYSILNPRQQKIFGFAGGSLPFSLNDINNISSKAEANKFFEYLEKQGLLPNDFSVDTFRKSNVQNARRLLRRVVEKIDITTGQSLKPSFETGATRFGETLPAVREYSTPKDIRPAREELRQKEIRDELYKQDVEDISKAKKSALLKRASEQAEELRIKQNKDDNIQRFKEERALRKDLKRKYKEIQSAIDVRVADEKRANYERKQEYLSRRRDMRQRLANKQAQKLAGFESFLQDNTGGLNQVFFEKNLQKELKKLYPSQRQGALSNFSQLISDRRLQSSQRINSINQAGTIGLALGLPVASGIAESFIGNNPAGRAISGALNLGGVGASIGGFFGPVGLGVGAALGLGGGALASIAREPQIKREEAFQRQLNKIGRREEDVGRLNTFTQQTASLQDLISRGAAPGVIRNQVSQITNLRSSISDKSINRGISKILNDNSLSASDKIGALQGLGVRQENKVEQNKRAVVADKDLEDIRLRIKKINDDETRLAQQSFTYTGPQSVAGRIQDRINTDSITNLSSKENREKLENIARSLADKAKFRGGVTSSTFDIGRQTNEEIIRNVLTPESFAEFQQRNKGVTGAPLDEILNKYRERLQENILALEDAKKVEEEANKEIKTRSDLLKQLNKLSVGRQLQTANAELNNSSDIFRKNINIQRISPFLTDVQKSLRENEISFRKDTNDISSQRNQGVNQLISEITSKISGAENPDLLKKTFAQLDDLNKNGNISNIFEKVNSVASSLVSEGGGAVANDIVSLLDTFEGNDQILQNSLEQLKINNTLTKDLIKKQDETAKSIAAFGGLSGLLNGRFSSSLGSNINSSAVFRSTKIPSAGIVGGIEQKRLQDQASISGAQSQLKTIQELRSQGFGEDFIKNFVDTNLLKKGRSADIRNNIFGLARNLVGSNPISQFTNGFGGQFDQAVRQGNLQPVISSVSQFRSNNPTTIANRDELVRRLQLLDAELKKAPKTAEDQVNAELKIAIEDNTKALNRLIELLGISGINPQNADIKSPGSFGSITLNASKSTDTEMADKFRDFLINLGYKVDTVIKQTKTIIPPTKGVPNPFSDINNTSL